MNMKLRTCLEKGIKKNFSSRGDFYGPPLGYKNLFNYDIRRVALCRLYYIELYDWLHIFFPTEVKYLKRIMINMSWAVPIIMTFLGGDDCVVKDFIKKTQHDFFENWLKFEHEIEYLGSRNYKLVLDHNPLMGLPGLNPLYIILSRLISLESIPDDFLTNDKYTYTKQGTTFNISVRNLIQYSYDTEKTSGKYNIYKISNWKTCYKTYEQEDIGLYMILCILSENRHTLTKKHKNNLSHIINSYVDTLGPIHWVHPILYYWCIDLNISIYSHGGLVISMSEYILN
jgi:hypothetical protein